MCKNGLIMNYNNDFRYDLKVGQAKEKELGNIFNNKKVEVKYDLKALKTGNVYVEYLYNKNPSGISTSEADYYCFAFGDTFHLIGIELLKRKCKKYANDKNRNKLGGDSNKSRGILLPITELL